jgi:hypothetical protein
MISDNTKELDALATLTNHGPAALSLHWGIPMRRSCFVFHRLEQPSPAAKHRPMDWRDTIFSICNEQQQTGGGSLADLPKDPSNELLGRPHGAN